MYLQPPVTQYFVEALYCGNFEHLWTEIFAQLLLHHCSRSDGLGEEHLSLQILNYTRPFQNMDVL